MKFNQKIRQTQFWTSFAKVAFPFFMVLVFISLLFNSFKPLFSLDFSAVYDLNFGQGKWIAFFAIKLVASVLYGFYTVNKNFK